MSNVSVEYLVLRDNVEYSRLTAFKGGGAAISVTADAAVKWALSGKFAQNRAVRRYLVLPFQELLQHTRAFYRVDHNAMEFSSSASVCALA